MGTIKFSVPDDLEEEFRRAAMERFGHERGSISRAGVEALKTWTVHYEEGVDERVAMGHPSAVDLLDGIAADTDLAERAESGVEIKDEIGRRRADAYERDRDAGSDGR